MRKPFSDRDLVVIFPMAIYECKKEYYGKTSFEHQLLEFKKYFRSVKIYAVLSNKTDGRKGTRITGRSISVTPMFKRDESIPDFFIHFFKYRRVIRELIRKQESDSIFLTFIPGTMIGLVAANELKKSGKHYFLRTVADLGMEYVRFNKSTFRRITGIVIKPLLDAVVQHIIKGAPNFNSGRVIYEKLPLQKKVISSSFRKEFIVKTKKSFREPYKLLYVGRLNGVKGIEQLIDAVDILKHRYDFRLDIIGDGELKDKILQRINDYDLDKQISLRGFVPFGPKLFKYYKEADVFIIPSLQEIQGKTHLEAMAFGTPVIASDIPAIRNTVTHKVHGILVKPGDANQIYRAVTTLIENKKLREKIIKNAYQVAKTNNIELQTKSIIKTIGRHCT